LEQDFRYAPYEDVYICPAGERLTYSFTTARQRFGVLREDLALFYKWEFKHGASRTCFAPIASCVLFVAFCAVMLAG